MTYRKSAMDKAGFKEFPKDFPGFLEMCKALKKNNTPAGFALGHATGDANGWLHWVLWGHGAYTVDKDDKVIINSPETVKALEYCQGAVRHLHSRRRVLERLAPTTRRSCRANSTAPRTASRSMSPPRTIRPRRIWRRIPITRCGRSVRSASRPNCSSAFPILAFNFTKYPNAAKAFIAFMLEKDQFEKWLTGARGYLTHTLNAYDSAPVWTADPKNAVFAQASKRALPASGIGTPGEKAATAIADFLVVDMFANYCTGAKDAKSAIAECRAAVEANLSLTSTMGGPRAIRGPPDRALPVLQSRIGRAAMLSSRDIVHGRHRTATPARQAADPRGHRRGTSSRPTATGSASGSCCRRWGS